MKSPKNFQSQEDRIVKRNIDQLEDDSICVDKHYQSLLFDELIAYF
jgi:16S rRNA C1402 N4-methylase RsmH